MPMGSMVSTVCWEIFMSQNFCKFCVSIQIRENLLHEILGVALLLIRII